jgi:ring-1,2-phenylacetyl-CoA epoxidase subunit PaaE
VENGRHSRWLIDRAAAGDRLRCLGAAGMFTLPEHMHPYRQVLLFAAGIGITPIYALIKTMLHRRYAGQVALIYSNRSAADTVFYPELKALQAAYPGRFRIEWLFSDAKNLARARFSKALMPTLLKEYWQALPTQTLCYTCGPYDYMWLAALLLTEAGIPTENIRKEIFYNDKPGLKLIPPDQDAHRVTIRIGTHTYQTIVRYPETILQAAKKKGIPLPYSCEAGQCSSCAVQCISGNVWLSYNEVLTEKDLAAGKVLTCTGYPLGGDVIIELIS